MRIKFVLSKPRCESLRKSVRGARRDGVGQLGTLGDRADAVRQRVSSKYPRVRRPRANQKANNYIMYRAECVCTCVIWVGALALAGGAREIAGSADHRPPPAALSGAHVALTSKRPPRSFRPLLPNTLNNYALL